MKDSEVADKIIHLRDVANLSWYKIADNIDKSVTYCKAKYNFRKKGGYFKDEAISFLKSFPPASLTRTELWEKLQADPRFSGITARSRFHEWLIEEKVPAKNSRVVRHEYYEDILKLKDEMDCSLLTATKTYFKSNNINPPKDYHSYIKNLVWNAYVAGLIK